jgi:hypothetical protein
MSEDIKQKTVISMLIIAMVISLGGTIVVLTKLSNISFQQQLTGFASEDSGTARINISTEMGITVDPTNNIINFGTCSRPISGTATISSKMTEAEINATDVSCTGTYGGNTTNPTDFPANITIQNTGNVETNITIRTNVTGTDLLGGTGNKIYFTGNNNSANAGCIGTLEEEWVELAATGTDYEICSSLNYDSPSPAIDVSIQLDISSTATTGTNPKVAGLEFWANAI